MKKRVLLICPAVFADHAEWEGVPLKEEVESHLPYLALKVNVQPLPLQHGYPVRLVAEGLYGGHWVKWLAAIEVR